MVVDTGHCILKLEVMSHWSSTYSLYCTGIIILGSIVSFLLLLVSGKVGAHTRDNETDRWLR